MGGVLAYALRRTSARVVITVGVGGLLEGYFRLLGLVPLAPSFGQGTVPSTLLVRVLSLPEASPWDVAAAALVAAVAVVTAAALWRDRRIGR